ncbi:MAG: transcription termination/antitermination factor NusG [Bacteroidales bacterium]|nr:transcription termination/antitermination factor NusG [Bacteroidales bacterium]
MTEITKKWYVVRTQGGKEKKAKEYLEKEIELAGLTEQVPQILVPTEKYYQIKNGKRVSAERIFLPGYILVQAALTGEIELLVRNTTYVAGFLSEGKDKDKHPVPIREAELNRILGSVDEVAQQEEETVVPYVVGEAVKIIDGPFNGFDGSVEKIMDDKRKLAVTVKIFGRKTIVELNFAQVTKV